MQMTKDAAISLPNDDKPEKEGKNNETPGEEKQTGFEVLSDDALVSSFADRLQRIKDMMSEAANRAVRQQRESRFYQQYLATLPAESLRDIFRERQRAWSQGEEEKEESVVAGLSIKRNL
jgi:hypothetical protein